MSVCVLVKICTKILKASVEVSKSKHKLNPFNLYASHSYQLDQSISNQGWLLGVIYHFYLRNRSGPALNC